MERETFAATRVGLRGAALAYALASGCGGSSTSLSAADGSVDATPAGDSPVAVDDAMPEAAAPVEASADAGASDATTPVEGGSACAPPSDPTRAALCITVQPEAVTFVSADPSFDGKGILVADVHDTANPNGADGGSLMALQSFMAPPADAGMGELDLSQPPPVIRFDGLPPGVVYPRVIFVDSRDTKKVGAGWWIGNYDLGRGLRSPTVLLPVTLQAGSGTSMTVALTALRALTVTLTRSVTPLGNGQGPVEVVVTDDPIPTDASALFGAATASCANLADAAAVAANGFVLGAGPYDTLAVLDDFGLDAGLAPGALTSLVPTDGGYVNPASARLAYPASAYVVTKTLDLDTVVAYPDAGVDPVSCP